MEITSRKAWGARKPKSVTRVEPSDRTLFIVHYSYGPADQAVRTIQDWCMNPEPRGRGFSDIDYNFLVRGTTGEIFEGRGWDVVGSHTKGFNTVGLGVCVITPGPIAAPAKQALQALYQEACARAEKRLTVGGHRDYAETSCPGEEIFRWVHSGGLQERSGGRLLQLRSPAMTGEDVKAVQRVLGIRPSGVFDVETSDRVRQFQRRLGLEPDAIVGPATKAKMGIKR